MCVCAHALLWPFGALGSRTGLHLPLTPCSSALGSHHRLCPRTTPPFPRLWAPCRRSGKQSAGWAHEQQAPLTHFMQMMCCNCHSDYTWSHFLFQTMVRSSVWGRLWHTQSAQCARWVLIHTLGFFLTHSLICSHLLQPSKFFFFFKVFQMWKKKGGGLGDTNREEQQKKKNNNWENTFQRLRKLGLRQFA